MTLSLGLSKYALRKMTQREKFSNYLPYIAYDPKSSTYYNSTSWGWIWECLPLGFASGQIVDALQKLMKGQIPEGSVMQFILYASPYTKHILEQYKSLKTTRNELLRESIERYVEFMSSGSNGMEQLNGIPLRNFRLFVTLSMPEDASFSCEPQELRSIIEDGLSAAKLWPVKVEPSSLILFLSRMLNDRALDHIEYDETVEIRKQILLSETVVENHMDHLRFGSKYVRITTPKTLPRESTVLMTNILTGGIEGQTDDMNQIRSPFMITYNIVFDDQKSYIKRKAGLTMQQQAAGSLVPSLSRRKEEFLWAVDELEKGDIRFFKVIPIVCVFGDSKEKVSESMVRIKRIWEQQNFVMQEDKGILPILFLSALPFGLYNVDDNVDMLDRHFILPSSSIAELLPVQADFQGSGIPQLLFVGRKGELAGLDLFDRRAENQNALIAASSGSGKSFFVNYIITNYLAAGANVRIIDIGRSYMKLCKIAGGKFLEFSSSSNICLNPFSNIIEEKPDGDGKNEDFDKELSSIASIILQMIYSYSDRQAEEIEASIVKDAVRWAYSKEGPNATIDLVYEYLTNFNKYTSDDNEELNSITKKLAYNLKEFTSHGAYGRWFCGKSTLDIKNDKFVVLELEELQTQKELFKVVLLQVLNYVTYDLYLSDRTIPRLIIFDEAWQFFKMGGYLMDVIENGDRRARKYKGSFIKIVQSVLDFERWREWGEVIYNNSAYKFFLKSSDYDKAKESNLLNYDDFVVKKLLGGLNVVVGKYSEIFMDTPQSIGVARLVVNPFLYYLYTTNPDDNVKIERLVKSEGDYLSAIRKLVAEEEKTKK